jgi:Na+/H+ antiporter NhaD/arsenite permease-like protein
MSPFAVLKRYKPHLTAGLALVIMLAGVLSRLPALPVAGQDEAARQPNPVHAITGRVLDPQGLPVFEAEVKVYVDDEDEPFQETLAQEDGYFVVEIPVGTPKQMLRIDISRHHFKTYTYRAEGEDLALLLEGESILLPDVELERRITMGFWVAAACFAGILLLMAFEKLHNTTATLLGVSVIFAFSYLVGHFYDDAYIISFEEAIAHIDFDVIFLVMGMMIVVGILEGTGIFQWMAFMAYRLSRGHIMVLVVILMIITSLASALMDNVTTMLLMTPISLQIALALGVDPLALVMPELLASNVGGISTLIGTPTNILIGSYANITFNDFLVNLTVGVVLALVVLMFYVRWFYRKAYHAVGQGISPTLYAKLEENAKIKEPAKLRKGLVVFGVMLLFFIFGESMHLDAVVTALVGATAFLVWVETDVEAMIRAVDWTTLVFFMAMFIAVGAVQEVGLISIVADTLVDVIAGQPELGLVIMIWAGAFISTAIANIPFTAAMLPVISFLSNGSGTVAGLDPAGSKFLYYGLSVGSAMGGNGSLIGASANVVTTGILDRAGYSIGYTKFMRVGMPAMIITIATGTAWLLFRFFVI